MKVNAFAALTPGNSLEPFTYNTSLLKPNEAGIKISHCGLCHSDVSLITGEWGTDNFPIVPGHEIIGTVEQLGSDVTDLKVGDRVGMSWQVGSCLKCKECLSGFEQLCSHMKEVCVGNFGGMADYIVVDSKFAYKIPDQISSQEAAPLMCAGITVYQPLTYFGIQEGMNIGVIGMGGLGHLAIQLAHAWDCKVTVFTRQKDKEKDAKKFGASELVTDIIGRDDLKRKFDIIIDTTNANLDWNAYLFLVAPLGKFILCGIPSQDITIAPFSLIGGQISVTGGSLGGRQSMREMLQFAAEKNIRPQVEVLPMSQVNEAIKGLQEGKARYRYVLEV